MYLYESHLGGLYSNEYQIDDDDLYCEQCGDSDEELGEANTFEEAWELIEHSSLGGVSVNGSGGFCMQYVVPFLFGLFCRKMTS